MKGFRFTVLLAAAALLGSGCAVASEASSPNGGVPEVVKACAPGFPDCEDTLVIGDDPMVEPEAPPTTEVSAPTTTVPGDDDLLPFYGDADWVVIYLMAHNPDATGPSPALIPVARTLAVLSSPADDLPRIALGFLLAGPTPPEANGDSAISSEIPEGTRLLDLDVAHGVASVDLSAEFASGSGTTSEIARLEQLVYTLTRFEEIDGIRLQIEGEPVSVFGGHGIVLGNPAVRTELDTMLPAILIELPAHWAAAPNPMVVAGTANTFEATVNLALQDAEGDVLWEGFATTDCRSGCRGAWETTIPYQIDEDQYGTLVAWETSTDDGSRINTREHSVYLIAG